MAFKQFAQCAQNIRLRVQDGLSYPNTRSKIIMTSRFSVIASADPTSKIVDAFAMIDVATEMMPSKVSL